MGWSSIIGPAISAAGALFGKKNEAGQVTGPWNALGALGGALGSLVEGVPSPMTGEQLGAQQLDYMNKAFPGTNPWERLGQGSAMTPVKVAEEQRKTQREVLANQRQITDKQTAAQREVAQIHAEATKFTKALEIGPKAVDALRRDPGPTGPFSGYDTQTTVAANRLHIELGKIKSEEKLNLARKALVVVQAEVAGHQSRIQKANADLAKAFAQAKLSKETRESFGTLLKAFPVGVFSVLGVENDAEYQRAIRDLQQYEDRRGRKKDIWTSIGDWYREPFWDYPDEPLDLKDIPKWMEERRQAR